MKFPKLFKYSTTGSLQEWQIEVENNAYRTHSGQVGGAITTTEWTTCKGKNTGKSNETTDNDQAFKESGSKYEKQIKLNQYRETIEELTTSKRFIEPMLAQIYNDKKDKINFNNTVFLQVKLNGVRCIVTKDGLFSRKGKEYISSPHINEGLKAFFIDNPNAVLDGELFNNELRQNLNKLISLVKKTKPTPEDIKESETLVQLHVYDSVMIGSYDQRYVYLQGVFKDYLKDSSYYKLIHNIPVFSHEEIEKYLVKFEEEGHEGVMIRLNGPYENKRSKYLLKHKSFVDDEFEIVSIIEGKGNLSGKCGTIGFVDKVGKHFEASPIGTHEFFEKLWMDRGNLIGTFATVKYKELTPLKLDGGGGVPSFGKVIALRNYE